MRSEFYVVAHDPFGSEQGTLSPALLASHLVIFFWFNPRSDRALNPQWIRRTAAGPRHVREQGGQSERSSRCFWFGWTSRRCSYQLRRCLTVCRCRSVCAARPLRHARCVVSHFIGREEKQGRTFVRFHVTDPKHRRKVTVSADLLTLPWKVFFYKNTV